MLRRRPAIASALAVGAVTVVRIASAESPYPDKPIRLIVPFAPGGNADLTGRLFAEALTRKLGQQIVVENRGGAGGAIGSEQLSKAPPDGYTLGLGSTGTYLVSPRMTGGKPPYTLANFTAVALLNTSSMVIEVSAQNPIKDWAGFLAYVRANPAKLTIGHPGNGSTNHLALLRLQQALDISFNIVPYKSMGPALADLLAGQIDAVIDQIPASIGHIRSGRLNPIAVTSANRATQLPDTPTLQQLGVKDFDAATPLFLMAPAGTPAAIVAKLNAAVNESLTDPAMREKMAGLGAETEAMTPQALTAFLQKEDVAIGELAKSGLLKSE